MVLKLSYETSTLKSYKLFIGSLFYGPVQGMSLVLPSGNARMHGSMAFWDQPYLRQAGGIEIPTKVMISLSTHGSD